MGRKRTVDVERRGVSDDRYREVDRHFAQVQSWHEELERLDLDRGRHFPAATEEDHAPDQPCCSLSQTSRQGNDVVLNHHDSHVRGLKHQLEIEREQRARLFQEWAREKEERLALQHYMEGREEMLVFVQQTLEKERGELKQLRAALEKKEETLDLRRGQWDRQIAERERTLADREKTLDSRQRTLDLLRCQLQEKATVLEEESRRPRIADAPLREQPVAREVECVQKTVQNEEPVCSHQPVESKTPEKASPNAHVSQLETKTELKEDLERSPPPELESAPDTACFEEFSMKHLSDDMEDSKTLVDRLVTFHLAKKKKWYQFWR
ncbi:MAG: hypothetical protein ACQESR_09730 [Planctomycetota bacterium]